MCFLELYLQGNRYLAEGQYKKAKWAYVAALNAGSGVQAYGGMLAAHYMSDDVAGDAYEIIKDRPADITDGKLTFTADVKNNTYTEGKTVKIITAVYNGNTLYGAKVTPATVAKDSTYPLNVTMDIPTTGLTENWITATFVWDDDGITPLVKKNSKTFGIDVINDSTKDITVAFIGGSITQGKNYTDPFIEKWQQDRTGKITMINAGIGGTNSS